MALLAVIDFAREAKANMLSAPFEVHFFEVKNEKEVIPAGSQLVLSRAEIELLKEEFEKQGIYVVDKVSGNEISYESVELPEPVIEFLKFDEWLPYFVIKEEIKG